MFLLPLRGGDALRVRIRGWRCADPRPMFVPPFGGRSSPAHLGAVLRTPAMFAAASGAAVFPCAPGGSAALTPGYVLTAPPGRAARFDVRGAARGWRSALTAGAMFCRGEVP